jgi:hypothetical protein
MVKIDERLCIGLGKRSNVLANFLARRTHLSTFTLITFDVILGWACLAYNSRSGQKSYDSLSPSLREMRVGFL